MKINRPIITSWAGVLVDFNGILQDQRGRPIPNALLRFYHDIFGYLGEVVTERGPIPGTPPERVEKGRERGFFSRPLSPTGNYQIDVLTVHRPLTGLPPVADAPALPVSTIELRLDARSPFSDEPYEVEPVRIELAMATVCGKIVHDTGNNDLPLIGATIHLYRDGECLDDLTGSITTDTDARFFVPDQPIGEYVIGAELDGKFFRSRSFIHDGELLGPDTVVTVR